MTTLEKRRQYQRKWYAKNRGKGATPKHENGKPEQNDLLKIVEAYKTLNAAVKDPDLRADLKDCFVSILSN